MKEKITQLFTPKRLAFFGVFIAAICALAWVAYHNQFVINPDGVAYISIAEQYAAGNISAAVNAYWSPLLSWVMVPLLWLSLSGQEAFVVVNFLVACFILLFGSYVIFSYTKNKKAVLLFVACILPFLLHVMAAQITPDLLVVAWVLAFGALLIRISGRIMKEPSFATTVKWASILAVFGALGYVTKLYLQPVFIVTLILFCLLLVGIHYKKTTSPIRLWRTAGTLLGATVIIYGLLCLLWVLPLTLKYDHFTFGSSYAFNNGVKDLPQTRMLLAPPHEASVTAWEDPTLLIDKKEPSSKGAENGLLGSLKERAAKIYASLPSYITHVSNLWVFLFASVLATGVFILLRKAYPKQITQLSIILLVFGVYFLGYAAHGGRGNHRYQWPMLALGILLVALLCGFLWYVFQKRIRMSFAKKALFYGLIALLPLSLFIQYTPYPTETFAAQSPPDLQIAAERLQQQGKISPGSRLAASDFATATFLGYYLQMPSFGVLSPPLHIKTAEAMKQLKAYDIDYYIDVNSQPAQYFGRKNSIVYQQVLSDHCEQACTLTIVKINH